MAKILLVEDDNNLREIYGARLTAEGYDIVSAADGEEALAIAVKEKPDLIISDVMMPKVSGFDMLDILRNAPETKDTKVIMMTALSQAEDKDRADKLGADLYLVKSQVTLEDVAASVRKILGDDAPADTSATPADTAADNTAPSVPAPETTPPEPPTSQPAPTPEPPQPPQPVAPPPQQPTPAPPAEPVPPAPPVTTPTTSTPADAVPSVSATEEAAPTVVNVSDGPQLTGQPAAPPAPEPPTSQPAPTPEPPQPPQPVAPPPQQPTPAPTPTSPPAADPAATVPPSEPSADSPVAPVAKKIEVVLPGDEAESADNTAVKDGDPAIPTAEAPASLTPPEEISVDASVGPNLAEALADEEKSIQSQIKEFEETPMPQSTATPTVVKPDSASETDSATPSPDTASQPSSEPESSASPSPLSDEGNPNRKVIQPLNDPTKGPDLEALLAKEAAAEAAEQSSAPSSTIGPDPSTVTDASDPDSGKDSGHPDDFSKISL